MPCEGCTEFLTQGSGTVGEGTNFSYEKVVIAEDPDNIPLVLLSVKALDKDDVLLVDQTPAWLEATTSGQSVLVGARLIYRLTVTVEIDAFRILQPGSGDPTEWGEGTYTIELRAQVEDGSKPVIVCLFDVCITGAVPAGALMFIGDQSNGIWSFDIGDVVGSLTQIITTEGSGVNPGRIAWDATSQKLLVVDARGADVTVFVYQFNSDGTGETKLGETISATDTIDIQTSVQVSSNTPPRIAFNNTNKRGTMELDGTSQAFYSEVNNNIRDLAPSNFDDNFYNFQGGADLFRTQYVTGSNVEMLDGVSVADVVTDRANLDELLVYWRTGKTIRRVAHDATGDTEIYAGADITDMLVLIGIDSGRIYFIYTLAGGVFIGSVTKAGADFQSHGRIDVIASTFWASTCATIAPETAGS